MGRRKKREGNMIKEELWGNLPSAIALISPTRRRRRHGGAITSFKSDLSPVESDKAELSFSTRHARPVRALCAGRRRKRVRDCCETTLKMTEKWRICVLQLLERGP